MKKGEYVLMVMLLLSSSASIADDYEENPSCSGFWGSINCFFWGNPENRAGQAWFERGALVG